MAFVSKQTAVLVVRINNNGNKNDVLAIFLSLYFTTHLSWPD